MNYTDREKTWIKFLYESTKGCKSNNYWLKNKPFFVFAIKSYKTYDSILNGDKREYFACMNWASNEVVWGRHCELVNTYECDVSTYTDKFGYYQIDWVYCNVNVNIPKIRKLYTEIFIANKSSNNLKKIIQDDKAITVKLLKKCDLQKIESDIKTESTTNNDNVIKENKKSRKNTRFCAAELIKFFDVGYKTSLVVTDIMNYLGCCDETARKLRNDLIKEGYIKELGYCQENKTKKLYEILNVPV